jgi:hypothetical protein
VRTLGVDLAAATKKTAAAVIEWADGAARLEHLSLDVDDQAIVDLFGSSSMTGIDWATGQSSDGRTPSCRSLPAT